MKPAGNFNFMHMKTILFTLCLLLSMPNSFTQSFAGAYSGDIAGVPASLQFQQAESQLTGKIDAQGYIYNLQGTAQGQKASGMLADPQTMATMNFEAELEGSKLTLTLLAQNIFTGQTERTPLYFTKSDGQAQAQFQVTVRDNPAQANTGEPCKQCDQQLVGAWIYTKTYFSGDFSSTTQLKMRIFSNGTYVYGNARVMASNSDDYGHVSADTGGSDEVTKGKWKTQNSIIYVMEEGTSNWYAYARYYIEGSSMLLTFEDGSKQLWERN